MQAAANHNHQLACFVLARTATFFLKSKIQKGWAQAGLVICARMVHYEKDWWHNTRSKIDAQPTSNCKGRVCKDQNTSTSATQNLNTWRNRSTGHVTVQVNSQPIGNWSGSFLNAFQQVNELNKFENGHWQHPDYRHRVHTESPEAPKLDAPTCQKLAEQTQHEGDNNP